jgi:hypothetical protein
LLTCAQLLSTDSTANDDGMELRRAANVDIKKRRETAADGDDILFASQMAEWNGGALNVERILKCEGGNLNSERELGIEMWHK